jgi:hypothetical protein
MARSWWRRTDDDFADEIRSHLELETERLVDEGLSPEDARLAARRRFGSAAAARERFYESRPRALAGSTLAGSALRRARHHALSGRRRRRRAVARRRHRRDHRHADDPRRGLPAAAGARARAVDAVARAGRVARPADYADRQPRAGALYAVWRDARLESRVAAATTNRIRDVRTANRLETAPIRSVTPEFFAVLGVDAAVGRTLSDTPRTAGTAPGGAERSSLADAVRPAAPTRSAHRSGSTISRTSSSA